MKRSKKVNSRKGKAVETSSSQQPKKRQLRLQEESDEERQSEQETEAMEEDEQSPDKPEWKVGTSLHTLPRDWQLLLYKEKLGESDSMKRQLIGERQTMIDEFRGFGLVESFERMGWTTGLVWNNKDNNKVYLEGIVEWMGTLEKTLGNNPPETTKLIGTVNGKKVVMSFATLAKIAKFDTGTRSFDYLRDEVLNGSIKGDNWDAMIEELFTFTPEQRSMNAKLERYFLKPLPRLIMLVLNWNVCPRTSDRLMVRQHEVVILYALVTGNLALSMRQIIMSNIWDARNKRNKTILPHPRLITSLIQSQKAIPQDIMMTELAQTPISLSRLTRGMEWRFEDFPMDRVLKDATKNRGYLIAPKAGFTREQVIAEIESRENGETRVEKGVEERVPRMNVGNIGARVAREIPRVSVERPEFYTQWSPYEQQMWDLTANQAEVVRIQAEEARERYEEQRRFERGLVYAHELEIRRRFQYTEAVRHHEDYIAGLPFCETPPVYNFRTIGDYEEEKHPAYPQSHDSEWFPRQSCVGRMETGPSDPLASSSTAFSSSTAAPDPFDGRSLYQSMMESIFGPPQGPRQ